MVNQKKGFEIEIKVKEILEERFSQKFSKIRHKMGNFTREIDIMSEDNHIAVQVKSGSDFSSSGRISSYRFAEICLDYIILMGMESSKKILVLTNKEMYIQFNKEIEGLPLSGVDVELIELD